MNKIKPKIILCLLTLVLAPLSVTSDAQELEESQIVFLAPDVDGIDQIWLADMSNPDNPSQLTFHEQFVRDLQSSVQNGMILYRVEQSLNAVTHQLWYLNLRTGEQEMLPFTCERDYSCETYRLSPNGTWVSYQTLSSENNDFVVRVHLYYIQSYDTHNVYEQSYSFSPSLSVTPYPTWVGHTDLLTYRTNASSDNNSSDEYVIYDIDEEIVTNQIEVNQNLPAPQSLIFSDDGLWYAVNTSAWVTFSPISLIDIYHTELHDHITYPSLQNTDEEYLSVGGLIDWYPDNEQLLFLEAWQSESDNSTRKAMSLFNVETGVSNILFYTEHNFLTATFNHDGSYLLYGLAGIENYQLTFYDMETGEEIALPLFGRNPQWVNGGR